MLALKLMEINKLSELLRVSKVYRIAPITMFYRNSCINANKVDPDQMLQNLGLHCAPVMLLEVS